MNKEEALTAKQIAEIVGVEYEKVVSALSHYRKIKLPYIARLKKKAKYGAYRYKITKLGKQAYMSLRKRYDMGVDLNRVTIHPKKVDNYYGITKKGKDMGLKFASENDATEAQIVS